MGTAIVDAIVRVMLPAYPELDAGVRRTVEGDVSQYVAGLIRSMPGFLRLPYALAMFGFEWLPLLRHGRRFRDLAPSQQATYLTAWSEAPVPPMRDFVKLIRSSALLAYFDHGSVIRRLEEQRQKGSAPAKPETAARA